MGDRKNRRRAPAWALLSALCGWAWCGTARAEAPDVAAREHFERGYALTQQGAFEQALDEFKLAYAASPNFSVLFNLGQAYGASGRPVQAAHTLERYLQVGGTGIDAEQRRRTVELIDGYRRRIGRVAVAGLPAGAVVSLDGEDQGTAPLESPLEASAGRHSVSVRAAGYQPLVRAVDVKAGEVTDLAVVLVVLPKPVALGRCVESPGAGCGALEAARQRRAKTQKTVALALGGGAILVGGTALTLAIINNARYEDWRKKEQAFMGAFQREPSSLDPYALEALLTEGNAIRNRDMVVVGLGVTAGALALTSLGLYLTAGSGAPTLSVSARGDFSAGYRGSF
jgi:tetratricopeptide (TPR) repeat protein